MRLYIVRHAIALPRGTPQIEDDDRALTEEGIAKMQQAAEGLRGLGYIPELILSSPLLRARQTARIVLEARADAPTLELDDRLREMDFGPYEGWNERELEADPVARTRRRDGLDIPGVETEASVEARARAWFVGLSERDGTTIVVGHGRMLRIFIATCILGMPAAVSQRLRMRNCRPAIVEIGSRPLLLGFAGGAAADERVLPPPPGTAREAT